MTILQQSDFVINYKNTGIQGFTPVGYQAPSNLQPSEWLEAGQTIKAIDRFKNFALGDWMLAGERRFGEMYAQALDEFEWGSYSKVSKIVWVARNVPHENRRADLTWMHHHNVASIPVQDQLMWLAYAADEHLTADELKEAIRASKSPTQTADAVDRMLAGSDDEPLSRNSIQYAAGGPVRDDDYDAQAERYAEDGSGYDWTPAALPDDISELAEAIRQRYSAGDIAALVAELASMPY